MKKVLFTLLFTLTLGLTANAQLLKFGAKAGLTTADLQGTSNLPNYKTESELGFQVGFLGRIKVLGFYVQPELLYTTAQSKMTYTSLNAPDAKQTAKIETSRIDIPVLVGYKLGPVRGFLGPVGSFNLNTAADIVDKTNYNTQAMTWAGQVGLGVDLLGFGLDLKYEAGLSSIGSGSVEIDGDTYNFDNRQNLLIGTFIYYF